MNTDFNGIQNIEKLHQNVLNEDKAGTDDVEGRVEVVVASMNADASLYNKMNLQTDAVVGNQCDRNEVEFVGFGNSTAKFYSFAERGVGLNRNNALLRASATFVLFADEDMVYVDNYADIVRQAFAQLPQADVIMFNIETIGGSVNRRVERKIKRVRFWNSLNYSTARTCIRLKSVLREGIYFNTNFGGGTGFSCGEDTLFIQDMLRSRLKIYAHPVVIASVDQTSSTWFEGYTDKYFYDKGVLLRAVSKPLARLLCFRDAFKRRKKYAESGKSLWQVYGLMVAGVKGYKSLRTFSQFRQIKK